MEVSTKQSYKEWLYGHRYKCVPADVSNSTEVTLVSSRLASQYNYWKLAGWLTGSLLALLADSQLAGLPLVDLQLADSGEPAQRIGIAEPNY